MLYPQSLYWCIIILFQKKAAESGGFSTVCLFAFFLFAVLIRNAAARLAGGLARGLAFAAAAVLCAFAEIAGLNGFDLDHDDASVTN
jgi:hypothetical protein